MVLLEGAWAEKGTPTDELPNLNFRVGRPWSKPDRSVFNDELIEDLQQIATLSIIDRHYQVLTSLDSPARFGFLATEGFKRVKSPK